MSKEIRLNRALSILGICSRRNADELIEKGEVFVNGIKISQAGAKINEGDKIKVFGEEYIFKSEKQTKVWIYYKKVGLVTTQCDEKGRQTIFEDVKSKIKERVISVGRLDINSEGLLLLTNNSDFSRKAESPKNGWERHYKVRVFGEWSDEIIEKSKKGLFIDGIRYAPVVITLLKNSTGKNHWVKCVLTEGKNREIRKIFNHFGLAVNRLIRIKYGPYEIGDLKPGEVRRVGL